MLPPDQKYITLNGHPITRVYGGCSLHLATDMSVRLVDYRLPSTKGRLVDQRLSKHRGQTKAYIQSVTAGRQVNYEQTLQAVRLVGCLLLVFKG